MPPKHAESQRSEGVRILLKRKGVKIRVPGSGGRGGAGGGKSGCIVFDGSGSFQVKG